MGVLVGDVLAPLAIDDEAAQGTGLARPLVARRHRTGDLVLEGHLTRLDVDRDHGPAVLGAHDQPAGVVMRGGHRVGVHEGRTRAPVLWSDAAEVGAHPRVDARAEEGDRRVARPAVRHHEQPAARRHAARHMHECVTLVGGGSGVGTTQREAMHARDAVLSVAHGLVRVGRAVECKVEERRLRVRRVVEAREVEAVRIVEVVDALERDTRHEH
mmetsp:Transcript_34230/g.80807  ORF Transcript_34230/g.80807 Transcript_34230/m.80807 type:complete len:214 (-) Transcript_34230:29-670(-)